MIIEETVTTCTLDSVSTLGCALAILIAGRWLKGKFKFLKKFLQYKIMLMEKITKVQIMQRTIIKKWI